MALLSAMYTSWKELFCASNWLKAIRKEKTKYSILLTSSLQLRRQTESLFMKNATKECKKMLKEMKPKTA